MCYHHVVRPRVWLSFRSSAMIFADPFIPTHFNKIVLKKHTTNRVLGISRQGFYQYLSRRERVRKYQGLADAIRAIHDEDLCNDTYGRKRMHQTLLLARTEGVHIPSERTVYRVMERIGLVHHPKRRPNGHHEGGSRSQEVG